MRRGNGTRLFGRNVFLHGETEQKMLGKLQDLRRLPLSFGFASNVAAYTPQPSCRGASKPVISFFPSFRLLPAVSTSSRRFDLFPSFRPKGEIPLKKVRTSFNGEPSRSYSASAKFRKIAFRATILYIIRNFAGKGIKVRRFAKNKKIEKI